MNLQLLPAEITTEILSRLPTESVVECKRVCKTWRSLIDEPAFGDAHTQNYLLPLRLDHSSSCNSMLFLVKKNVLEPDRYRCVVTYELHCGNYINAAAAATDDDDDKMGGGFKISKPPNNISDIDSMNWMMVGSTNGLICLSGDKGVYVYNPFTSEYVNLGHPTFKTSPRNHAHYNLYGKGFGYNPSTNEYKVVFTYYILNQETGRNHWVGDVSVYTIGSGTWRTKEEEVLLSHMHRPFLRCTTPGVLMNGAIHWIRLSMDGNYPEIVSFDLAEEKFISNTIMPSVLAAAPILAPNYFDTHFQLGLLGGCLCITQHNKNSSDIWIMNNKDKSWTMKFKITHKDEYRECFPSYSPAPGSYDPIALLGNGRKILLSGTKTHGIFLYDIETGELDYDILPNRSVDIRYAAIPFVKSFVSLKTLGEEGAKRINA